MNEGGDDDEKKMNIAKVLWKALCDNEINEMQKA